MTTGHNRVEVKGWKSIFLRNAQICLLFWSYAGPSFAQVDNKTSDVEFLYRPGRALNATTAGGFGDQNTLALDRDTLAVGSFFSEAICGGWAGATCPSYKTAGDCDGCILDYSMAAKLVEWFGNEDWYLAYSNSKDGFSNTAFRTNLGSSSPSIVVIYSSHLSDGANTGTYVFGGYTTQSWSSTNNLRCADSTITGGSGSVYSCNYWQTCTTNADCVSSASVCTCDSSSSCDCCSDNTCISVCSHTADANAYLFRLMVNSVQDMALYSSTSQGREIYVCSSDTTVGPTFGAQGSGTSNNQPPYTDFALMLDLAGKTGSTNTYGFNVPAADWTLASQTGWRIDAVEIYTIVPGASDPRRGLFQYAPRGAGASGDQSVHMWYRNLGSGNSWGYLKRIALPAWADSWMYGFSVALDLNTLVVGRRGNRDVYVHERHRSDCTSSGNYFGKLCADRGSYSADNWGLVQQISFPGSDYVDASGRNVYGGIWTPVSCCTPPATTPRIQVGEWGCSVDVQGDWLVVGAYTSSLSPGQFTGAAFVYQRDYTGDFIFAAELDPPSTSSYQHCGWDVALDGEYAVVGCYGSPVTGSTAGVPGSVLFFERNPPDGSATATSPWWRWGQPPTSSSGYSQYPIASQWALIADRTAVVCNDNPACSSTTSQSTIGDFFGYSVDISGTTVIVGAFMQRSSSGNAYIFERNFYGKSASVQTTWQISKSLVAPDDAPGLYFGFAVSIQGSFAAVSALKENDGRVYLFGRNYGGLNNWGFIESLKQPTVGTSSLQFPSDTGMNHVWNYWSDGAGSLANGAQLLHTGPYYNSTAMITSSISSPVFGACVQIWGHTVVIGAPYADLTVGSSVVADVGTVILTSFRPVHRQSAVNFDEATIVGSQYVQGMRYGAAVHITADAKFMIIGAPQSNVGSTNQAGMAYIFVKGPNGKWNQVGLPLTVSDPGEWDLFGTAINSVEFRACDLDPGATAELLIAAPGKTNAVQNLNFAASSKFFIYPPAPRQSISMTMPKAGAVYVFAMSSGWATTVVTGNVYAGSAVIPVASGSNLMGGSATGTVIIGRNSAVLVLSWNASILNVDNSTVLYPITSGTEAIASVPTGQPSAGFQQVEKLTALSTSCGQAGNDFVAVWDSTRTSTHVSDYSNDMTVMLQQPLTVGDQEICLSNIAILLGASIPGGSAPFTQGDPTDVIAWVKIGSNPAVGILNNARPISASSCAPNAATNSWVGSLGSSTYYVVKIASYSVSTAAATSTIIFKAPLYTVSPPYTACLDGEYVTSGRLNGGSTVVATSASTSSSNTLNCATGTLLPQCLTSSGLSNAFDIGSSTLTVLSAAQLFQAVAFGVVQSSTSSTAYRLESIASNVPGWYIGYDITVDLDGNIGTTTDVCTTTISAYQSTWDVTVDVGCSQPVALQSIYTISRWRSRPYISTGANLQITVTDVNFGTNELTVSGIVAPGSVGEPVYQSASNSNQIQLDPASPSIDGLYDLSFITIVQGKGAGQRNLITNYHGQTRVANTASTWTIPPDATSEYIITGKSLCTTNLQVTIDGPSACADDGFGFSIAVGRQNGNRHVMAIGAPWADSHQHCSSYSIKSYSACTAYRTPLYQGGRVYLFERHSNGTFSRWRLSQILEAPSANGLTGGVQGSPAAMSNDDFADNPFHGAASYDRFGYSVAMWDDQVIVGAPWSGIDDSGAVFVFERNFATILRGTISCSPACTSITLSIGTVTRQSWDTAEYSPSFLAGSYIGCSITIGNAPKQETRQIVDYSVAGWQFGGVATVEVSHPFSSIPDIMTQFRIHSGNSGKCGVSNNWGFKQTIIGSSRTQSDFFGWSLAVTEQMLIVGAPGYDVPFTEGAGTLGNTLIDAGGVFVFQYNDGARWNGCFQPEWTELQILTQTSDTSVDSNMVSRLGTSVTVNKLGDTIVAGAPLHDGDSFKSATEPHSQRVGWLGSSGAVVIFRRQDVATTSFVTSDFQPSYRSETILLSVQSVQDLFQNKTSGTISIGPNQAIEIISVDKATNTMYATAATVPFAVLRLSYGLSPLTATRQFYWRNDQVYIPSTAVAAGNLGQSVSMWDGETCVIGAPNAETNVSCCGSTSNTEVRGGTAHILNLGRTTSEIQYSGSVVESGTIVNVTDATDFTLASTASNIDGAYLYYTLLINSEAKLIVSYTGISRLVTVIAAFSTLPVIGTSQYTISSPAYTSANILNTRSTSGVSCRDLFERGYMLSGYYWLESESFRDSGQRSATAFVGYCDQFTDGGGWLMCYTDDQQVDIAHEYGFRASSPFGNSGYRSDCRNTLFDQILYIYHTEIPAFKDLDRIIFHAKGRLPITASMDGWKGSSAHDAYGNLSFTASSPDSNPTNAYPYQLNICANGYGTGFLMSGLISTVTCPNSWKTCCNWCDDHISDYYRHAYSPKKNAMNAIPVNFTGVSFRENGHKQLGRRLMSVGIRNNGSSCQSGWTGNGIQCICPAIHSLENVVAYWRFESGIDTMPVFTYIDDVSKRTGSTYSSDTRIPSQLGSGTMTTTSLNNDLEFVNPYVPTYSVTIPANQPYAVLCVKNQYAMEFSSGNAISNASFLQTVSYASMNTQYFTSFSWELSVYLKNLTGEQAFLCWHNDPGNYSMYFYKSSSNQLAFSVTTRTGTITALGKSQFDIQQWHHVAVTYDGGIAGVIRLWRLDTGGSVVTGSDCVDRLCLVGRKRGSIGRRGGGLGIGLYLLSGGTSTSCSTGQSLSAVGGGICSAYATVPGAPCTIDSDCGVSATCSVGAGFSAIISGVSASGSVTSITITNPGMGYLSTPKLIVSSASCTCNALPGNIAGNMDACLRAVPSNGTIERKEQWALEAELPWASMSGWGYNGYTLNCSSSVAEPCPFLASPTSPGWRWSVGRNGDAASYLVGLLDEIRITSRALDLTTESLWRT